MNYRWQWENNHLKNTGNATLRILAYGPCREAKDGVNCKENYFLMPGKTRTFNTVNLADKQTRVALWQADRFVPVK